MVEANNLSKSQVQAYSTRKKRDYKLQFVVNNLTTQKRIRPLPHQTEGLEKAFLANPKPSKEQKTQISNELNLNFSNVNTWFQNRRAKQRMQRPGTTSTRFNSDKSVADASSFASTPMPQSGILNPLAHSDSSVHNLQKSSSYNTIDLFKPIQPKPDLATYEPYTKPLRRVVNRSAFHADRSEKLELPELSSLSISSDHWYSDPHLYKLENNLSWTNIPFNFGLDRLNINLPKP